MSKSTITIPWTTLIAKSGTEVFLPATPWIGSQGIRQLRAVSEIRGIEGNLEVGIAYQVANVYDEPGADHGISTGHQAVGYNYPSGWTDPTTDLADKLLIRFGLRVRVHTGSDTAWGRVAASIQIVSE